MEEPQRICTQCNDQPFFGRITWSHCRGSVFACPALYLINLVELVSDLRRHHYPPLGLHGEAGPQDPLLYLCPPKRHTREIYTCERWSGPRQHFNKR